MRVTVVGAGVIGLTCAIRLAEAGHAVQVVAAARTPNTTSDVAAAIYFPYLAEPRDRILAWGARTLESLRQLAEDPESGVAWQQARIIEPRDDPWWSELVDDIQRLGPTPHGIAYTCRVPVLTMSRHMPFLEAWALRRGVKFQQATVRRLDDIDADVIVNATGLGARELANDATMYPIQGQIVRVAAPHIPTSLLVESDPPTYVIVRSDGVVVGGTAVRGAEDLQPDGDVEQDILQRARGHEPRLAGATVLDRRVGLRPGRPTIRLERDDGGARPVVHCYGHGGSGVTLAWGCADAVVQLVEGANPGKA